MTVEKFRSAEEMDRALGNPPKSAYSSRVLPGRGNPFTLAA